MTDIDTKVRKPGGLEKNHLQARVNETLEFEPHPATIFDFSRHVCQIIEPTVSGSVTKGTGFLVGPDLVLTCFHVVENIPVDELECRFDVKIRDNGEPTWGPRTRVLEIVASSRYSEVEGAGEYDSESQTHPSFNELDYALLRLDRQVGSESVEVRQETYATRGWLSLPKSAPNVDRSSEVSILQHPGGAHQQSAIGTLADGQPPKETRLRYLVNTLAGSSGSPCFQWSSEAPRKLLLVAMHNYGDPGWSDHNYAFNHGVPVDVIHGDLAKQLLNLSSDIDLAKQVPNLSSDIDVPKQVPDLSGDIDEIVPHSEIVEDVATIAPLPSQLFDSAAAAQYINLTSKVFIGEDLYFDQAKLSSLAREKVIASHQNKQGSPHYFDKETLDKYVLSLNEPTMQADDDSEAEKHGHGGVSPEPIRETLLSRLRIIPSFMGEESGSRMVGPRNIMVGFTLGTILSWAYHLAENDPLAPLSKRPLTELEQSSLIEIVQNQTSASNFADKLKVMVIKNKGPFKIENHEVRFKLVTADNNSDLKHAVGNAAIVCTGSKLANYILAANGSKIKSVNTNALDNTKVGSFHARTESQIACDSSPQEAELVLVNSDIFVSIFGLKPELVEVEATFDATVQAMLMQK